MRFSPSSGVLVAAALLSVVTAAPSPSLSEFASKSAQGLRLLSLEDNKSPVWKSEAEKLELMRSHVNFFDITDVYAQDQLTAKNTFLRSGLGAFATFPTPSHQTQVKALILNLSTSNMQSNLATLTAYNNRYYKSTTGAQSATWIQTTLKTILGSRSDINVSAFAHSWTQSSTIARISGTTATTPVTIIGAHMDSINLNSPMNGRAPGADDDGTGTVNLIEIFRVLVAANFKPSTPIEFHFYSGEEGGLLGSQAIASSYNNKGTKVKAMMELDMTGYTKPGTKEVIGFMTDNTDAGLNTFMESLVTTYLTIGYDASTKCGYGCSDHASWYKYGAPTTMPFETRYGNDNPNIHSSSDTTAVNGFSWTHSLEFAKLGLAYLYELTAA